MAEARTKAENSFWTTIEKFFTDLTTLDVVTLTGKINLTVANVSNFEDILENLKTTAVSEVKVLAVSHHQIDSDAVMFVKGDLDQVNEKPLLAMHQETVKAAQEMRNKVVEMVANAITGIIK